MMRPFTLLIALGLCSSAAVAHAADDGARRAPEGRRAEQAPPAEEEDEPFPLHFDFEGAWARQSVRFFSPPNALAPCSSCYQPQSFEHDVIRFTAGLGWGVLTLEGSVAVPPERETAGGIWIGTWTAGFRIDTSYTALFSGFFRGAYLQRWGTVPGKGGRIAAGLQIRPIQQLVVFAEGAIDGTTVPSFMNESGTVFSYSMSFSFGGRVVFTE